MRKALIRTTAALAVLAGVGVVHAGGAQALPEEVTCQNVLPFSSCLLATEPGLSNILRLEGDGLVLRLLQAGGGGASDTVALGFVELPEDGGVVFQAEDVSAPGLRGLIAQAGIATPGDGNFTGLTVQLINDDGAPDSGKIELSRSEDDADELYTGIAWENGDCTVYQNGHDVAPCIIQAVPQLPYVPFLFLP